MKIWIDLLGGYLIYRLEILAYQESNATHLFLVVSGEPFHGWHRNYWMVTVVGYLRRLGTLYVFSIFFSLILTLHFLVDRASTFLENVISRVPIYFCLLQVDVFSFGIAMWEILTGEEPYANLHCGAIIGKVLFCIIQNYTCLFCHECGISQ